MLAMAVVLGAVAIPLASGAADKTFTLSISPTCIGASTTVTLKNTAQSQTLGSIQIYFPAGSLGTPPPSGWTRTPNATSSYFTGTRDILARDNLNLAKGATTTVVVPLTANAPSGEVSAVGKQANKFNDSSGTANLFERNPAQTAWPRLDSCATISGRVFNDRNGNGTFEANGTPGDTGLAWDVFLYKNGGSGYVLDRPDPAPISADGNYQFTGVPTQKDYRLCVRAKGATDTAKAWALVTPTAPPTCSTKISDPSDPSPAAIDLPGLAGSVVNRDFAVVQVTAPIPCGGESEVTDYTVQLGNAAGAPTSTANCDKPSAGRYVQDSFTNAGIHYFLFAPAPGAAHNEVLLVEQLTSTFDDMSKLQSTVLKYDDQAPYFDNLQEMPGCKVDPRTDSTTDDPLLLKSNLDKSTILPGTATSCLIVYEVAVGPAAGTFTRTDYAFTAVDGGRGMG
jgi:hypothetical protein